MNKNILLGCGCVVLVFVALTICAAAAIIITNMSLNNSVNNLPTPVNTPDSVTPTEPTPPVSPVDPNGVVDPGQIEPLFIPEVEILEAVTARLSQKSWQGGAIDMPISAAEIDNSLLAKAINNERERESRQRIPDSLQSLFIGGQAEAEIKQLIFTAYDEYVSFLETQGVNAAYIAEFKNRALPKEASRFVYTANNLAGPPAYTEKYDGAGDDYGQVMIRFNARHFYNQYTIAKSSKLYTGADADKSYRDMGIRFLAYHEFGHALQRAHANVNLPAGEKTRKSYTDALLASGKSLMSADDNNWKFKWGPSYLDNLSNQIVSEERQSDSIAFAALQSKYKLSGSQASGLHAAFFHRLSAARDIVNRSLPTLNRQNPDFDLTQTGTALVKAIAQKYPTSSPERTALTSMLYRLDALPSYAGYFNPMSESELQKLWGLLKI